ncbi:HK97 gp10 family phage protein [Streptomyces sp. NPDC007259]|uniref:HK97 gp10 family phage protein n=1 Tax=Streptomyces sp. NPDC007259 TaxID=3154319 RepID=UPI00345562D6
MPRVRLDRAALNRTIRGASRNELDDAARQVLNRAKVLAPVDTGRLRASIRIESRRTLTLRSVYTIGSDVHYAPYVNDGTRPHVIRPKRAKALRFNVGGRTVFAAVVNHPGTRANPFLDRALREVAASRGYSFRHN